MKLDDLAQRAAEDARRTTATAEPPGLERIAAASRRRQWVMRGAAVAGAAAVIAISVGISSMIGVDDLDPRISDPAVTTLATTTTAPVTEDGRAVIPGIDEATAATIAELPHPGVTLLTEATLTDEIVVELINAIDGLDFELRNEPLQVHAAFAKDGVIHALVEYSSPQTALMVVENGEVTRYRRNEDPWIDVHAIRKSPTDWFSFTQVTWLGLPENAAFARLTTPQRPDSIEDQVVIGGAAFFEIAKPSWTQLGTLSVFDSDGQVITSESVRLHGNTCSSGMLAPPTPDAAIPDALEAGRVALATATQRCRATTIASLAVGAGPYFGLPGDDLAAELRDLDLRTGVFGTMLGALNLRPQEVEGTGDVRYVFDWSGNTAIDEMADLHVELGFSEDGVWQYGVILEQ